MINIVKVKTKKQLKDFIAVPNSLYQNNEHYRVQLDVERLDHLSDKNPYFKHAKHILFIAYIGDTPVGRISAQIDTLAQKENEPHLGHFGFLDVKDEDTLTLLIQAAENWLVTNGVEKIMGPYSFSINDEAGLLIEGSDSAPRMMMNYAPPWLSGALEGHGYTKAKDLLAFTMPTDQETPVAAQRISDKVLSDPAINLRILDKKHMKRDLTTILNIFNDAWAHNWGFIPMTTDEISHVAKNMKPLIKPDLVQIIEHEGKPSAMIVALPDLNEALKGLNGKLLPFGWAKLLWRLKFKGVSHTRVLLMGVKQDLQSGFLGSTLAVTLMTNLHEAMRKNKYQSAELSWILEDNAPMIRLIEGAGGHVYKRYRIYEKILK